MTMFDDDNREFPARDHDATMPSVQPPALTGVRGAVAPPPCVASLRLGVGHSRSDARLHRSNLALDPGSAQRIEGLPLYLSIRVYSTRTPHHAPLAGVQVELHHCDSQGRYAAPRMFAGANHDRLRGHQFSDADGIVMFQTIYPGWQSGRAVHIHLGARYHDRFGHAGFTYATELYFDDEVSDAVHARAPYAAHGKRDTRNGDDAWFAGREDRRLRLRPTGDHSPGYLGEIALGLALAPSEADMDIVQRYPTC